MQIMKTGLMALVMSAVTLVLISCSETRVNPVNSTPIRGSGVMASEVRVVPQFDGLTLSAAGIVNVTIGTPRSVTVTVDDNIMPYVETALSGTHLDIRARNGVNLIDYDLVVNVVVPELNDISLKGAGEIIGHNTLQGDRVDLFHTGAGTLNIDVDVQTVNTVFSGTGSVMLSGTADHHGCQMSSVGSLKAFDLLTNTTSITLSGMGSAEVNVADSLTANLTGVGSVYYRGAPIITGAQTGIGRVVSAN